MNGAASGTETKYHRPLEPLTPRPKEEAGPLSSILLLMATYVYMLSRTFQCFSSL